MKFARYLEENAVDEWRKAYLNYAGLKKLIKRACACEQAPEQLRSSILTRITYERTEVRYEA